MAPRIDVAPPVRVLELLVSTDLGGGPAHVLDLVVGLSGDEFHLTVAGPPGGPYEPRFAAHGACFEAVSADRLSVRALIRVVRLIRERRIQIVHSHGKGAGLYGRLAARLTGAAAIHTFHGIHPGGFSRLYLGLERALARWSHSVIHVSASQAEEARRLGLAPAGRSRVIVNGIDVAAVRARAAAAAVAREELGLRPDALVLATVARLDPVKGLDVLLRAVPLLASRMPAAQLLIVGDGPERERLRALGRTVDPGGRVIFAGAVADAVRLLPRVDLYVTASRREGLPLAVLEAMACGIPVLATRVPGHVDAVEDGLTGRLVPADDPEQLAAAAAELLGDPTRRAAMGEAARERVAQRFDRGRMVAEIAHLYRAAAGRGV